MYEQYTERRRRQSYPSGYITKTVTLSLEAVEVMKQRGIINQSQYINDIILWSLENQQHELQLTISEFNALQEKLKKFGYETNLKKYEKL